jgi:hypothetical protein
MAEHKQVTESEELYNILAANKSKSGPGDLAEHLQKLFNFFILNYPGQAL